LLTLVGYLAGIVGAYWLGRGLAWRGHTQRVLAGLAAGAGMLLLPAMQVRHDLKQYTTDAAVAIILLALASRTEAALSRGRLAIVASIGVLGMLLSHTAAVMGAAVMISFAVVHLLRRRWRALAESVIAGALTSAGMLAVYLGIGARGRVASVDEYWRSYFPSADRRLPAYLNLRLGQIEPAIGLPWPLFLALAAGGVLVIAWRGRPVTALAAALVPVIMIALGVGGAYPLLDARTSTFVLAVGAALAGLAVAGAGVALGQFRGREVTATVMVVATFAAFVVDNRDWWRLDDRTGPNATVVEDVRSQVRYVAGHRQPGDVILVNALGAFGFAFYWDLDDPTFVDAPQFAVQWSPTYPDETGIVLASNRDAASVEAAVARAERLASSRGPDARIWVIRTHVTTAEAKAWVAALGRYAITQIDVGVEPLVVIAPTHRAPPRR
jgi:hypothetical protein